MPCETQSRLEPKRAYKAQQKQAPSASAIGSSWGLLFQVHGQKGGQSEAELSGNESARHEDFQSSHRSGTMCHYRSVLVSIQAFNTSALPFTLPIRTHSGI